MNHELQEYNDAIVNRAKIQARLCCDPECEDCRWFDECQGRVNRAELALLTVLAD
jgi:MoaA/NifB/PqqE/SkfB family radical SAM enzyme